MISLFRMHHSCIFALVFLHVLAKIGPVRWSCAYGTPAHIPALSQNCVVRWSCAGGPTHQRPAHYVVGVWLGVGQTWPEGFISRVLGVAHVGWNALVSVLVHNQRSTGALGLFYVYDQNAQFHLIAYKYPSFDFRSPTWVHQYFPYLGYFFKREKIPRTHFYM